MSSGNIYNAHFIYNNINQLVKQESGSGSIFLYAYDNNGNLIQINKKITNGNQPTKIYSYNNFNQRIKVASSSEIKTISYNTLGQILKTKTVFKNKKTFLVIYTYNSEGKITQGIESDGDLRIYTYKNKSCIHTGAFTTSKDFLSAICKK
jgi:YD repeat-containing protein